MLELHLDILDGFVLGLVVSTCPLVGEWILGLEVGASSVNPHFHFEYHSPSFSPVEKNDVLQTKQMVLVETY